MPTEIPKLDVSMEKLAGMSYQETAYEVMKLFLTDYTEEELRSCIAKAYDSKFDTEEIAPLAKPMALIIWNFTMGAPLRLRIWHYLFCLI